MEFNKAKEKANKESEYLSDWEDKGTWKRGFEAGYIQAIEESKAPEIFEILQKLLVTFSSQDLELYQVKRLEEAEKLLTKITE